LFGPHKSIHETGYEGDFAINQLLEHLGVQTHGEHDEFESIGLSRYRSSEDWLKSA